MDQCLLKAMSKLSTDKLTAPLYGAKYKGLTLMEWAVYQRDEGLIETLEIISKERTEGKYPGAERITEVDMQKVKLLWQKESRGLSRPVGLVRKLSLLPTLADFYL